MSHPFEFRGGPLSGMKMDGSFSRKDKTYYPDKLQIRYDTVLCKENLELCPEARFAADAEAIVADYDFDASEGFFQFSGWTMIRLAQPDHNPK